MRFLGILILIVLFLSLVWPKISAWLKRKAIERAENYMRRAMGMPPREKEGKRQYSGTNTYGNNRRHTGRGQSYEGDSEGPIIPKEYAEDVEFIETKDYSSRSHDKTESASSESFHESQISDVEWTEIKR